jgi:hypothetical protein
MATNLRTDPELAALVEQARREHETPHRFTFWDLTDDGLIRIRRDYLRLLEDNPGKKSTQIDGWLVQIRRVRLVRWCLHMRYGAVDEHLGTKAWDRYNRFGDAPAYSLAIDIDKLRWSYRDHPKMPKRGTRRHILTWADDTTPHPIYLLDSAGAVA